MEYIKLNNGEKLPELSFDVYEIEKEETTKAVLKALDVGYRSIDNAQIYHNEKEVGDAVKQSEIPREEIFLTSKNWITKQDMTKQLKESIKH